MRKSLLSASLLALLLLWACGKSEDPFGPPPLPAGGGDGGGVGPSVPLTATLKGKIAFTGDVPVAKKIPTSSDPACKNPGLVDESVVVSSGGLENVIIYVSSPVKGSFPPPKESVQLDQNGCHYVPHALTIQVGQELKITNSDDTAHNIHAWAEINSPFNESQPSKGLVTMKKFTKEEITLPIKCDVHGWMNSFVGVFTHPLHTVSKSGGAYEIKMPAGQYEVTAIHEKYGKKTMMVDIPDNGMVDLNFTFSSTDKS